MEVEMSDITRRTFLKQSGATAAAAGALVAVPKGISKTSERTASARRATTSSTKAKSASKHMIVHVPDSGRSELRIMVGEREVVVKDRELVSRLVAATR
jgi:hypothetical protein